MYFASTQAHALNFMSNLVINWVTSNKSFKLRALFLPLGFFLSTHPVSAPIFFLFSFCSKQNKERHSLLHPAKHHQPYIKSLQPHPNSNDFHATKSIHLATSTNAFMRTWEEMMSTAFFDPAPTAFYASTMPLQTRFIAQRQIQGQATGRQSQLPTDVLLRQREIHDALNASTRAGARTARGRARRGRGE